MLSPVPGYPVQHGVPVHTSLCVHTSLWGCIHVKCASMLLSWTRVSFTSVSLLTPPSRTLCRTTSAGPNLSPHHQARATAGLGQLDIAAPADQQHNHAQQLVIANTAAAGGQEQLLVHLLAELNSKQQAAERARALPPQQAAAALPLDVMDTPAVEEALYGTTEVACMKDAAGKKKIEDTFPGYLK